MNLIIFRYYNIVILKILDIVSLRDITSYLLVTPVYLSRIRKKLAKNPANKTCFIPMSFFLTNFA